MFGPNEKYNWDQYVWIKDPSGEKIFGRLCAITIARGVPVGGSVTVEAYKIIANVKEWFPRFYVTYANHPDEVLTFATEDDVFLQLLEENPIVKKSCI